MTASPTGQLDLLAVASHPVRDHDRDLIDAAILDDGYSHDGIIDQARVREALTKTWDNGKRTLTVPPRLLSARYSVLRAQGLIERDSYHVNTSPEGGNGGKWYPTWRVVVDGAS